MSSSKTQSRWPDACAGNTSGLGVSTSSSIPRFTGSLCVVMLGLLAFLPIPVTAVSYTVNVSMSTSAVSPSTLQQDILNTLTVGQYLGTAVKNPLYTDPTYSVKVKGKNPAYQGPAVSSALITLDTISSKLVAISSDNFTNTFGEGMYYERQHDLDMITGILETCANDDNACRDVVGEIYDAISEQN